MRRSNQPRRVVHALLLLGWVGFLLLPWYAIEDGFFSTEWLPFWPLDPEVAPAWLQAFSFDKVWLLPLAAPLAIPLATLGKDRTHRLYAPLLIAAGSIGLSYGALQGFSIGPLGAHPSLQSIIEGRQFGMGYGALLVHLAFLLFLTEGLAARGFVKGDAFVAGSLGLVIALVLVFVIYPIAIVLLRAFETEQGDFSLGPFAANLSSPKLWTTAWNSFLLAVLAGAITTALGLVSALGATRTRLRRLKSLRALTILPVITPPFVIGLALVLAFGRSGAMNVFLERAFGLEPGRGLFGLPGILTAQVLAFTPVAFLILIGVLEGISPSMEEAAQTLRAGRWATFRTVTLPLIRPGLANAFLVGFVESLADFGNPLVLGSSEFEVLATEIYFAVAGAQNDVPRAGAMALILLSLTLGAFVAQERWVGKKSYTTVTGKGDAGIPCPLPRALEIGVVAIVVPWALFTVAIYALVIFGGFVKTFGRDHTLTLKHYAEMFSVSFSPNVHLTGGAWSSLLTTIELSLVAAPLTALFGVLTAYLLARQRFKGHGAFEFGTMLSFAVPGTVAGVSYVLAFNVPPLELTGTGVILVLSFVFRNMPVGIRSGLAALSQLDKSLDEASLTLGAGTFTTFRRVLVPLLRPALVAALVYGFARAMTAVSAVIFLVSADHNLATTYILGRVEAGDYGPAIAYSSLLIVLMLAAIGGIQLLVGKRNLGRRAVIG